MKFERPSKIQATSLPMILTPPYRSLVAQVCLSTAAPSSCSSCVRHAACLSDLTWIVCLEREGNMALIVEEQNSVMHCTPTPSCPFLVWLRPLIGDGPLDSLCSLEACVQAHNGSGKTTCFVLAMLSRVDPALRWGLSAHLLHGACTQALISHHVFVPLCEHALEYPYCSPRCTGLHVKETFEPCSCCMNQPSASWHLPGRCPGPWASAHHNKTCLFEPDLQPVHREPQALCVCPTRELVAQNQAVLEKMGKFTGISCISTATAAISINRSASAHLHSSHASSICLSRSLSVPPLLQIG